jgi:hypothetical protein
LIIAGPSVVPIAFIFRNDFAPAWFSFLAAVGAIFGYLEFKRFQVFRRDLRERQDFGQTQEEE